MYLSAPSTASHEIGQSLGQPPQLEQPITPVGGSGQSPPGQPPIIPVPPAPPPPPLPLPVHMSPIFWNPALQLNAHSPPAVHVANPLAGAGHGAQVSDNVQPFSGLFGTHIPEQVWFGATQGPVDVPPVPPVPAWVVPA